ncbi:MULTISPECIES: L,D-transpeptidase [Bradyrhizobium]|uniref:L,D-transpeptidase n=1 Tax=Bradyrhizobium TaxID=374 RepID=UPI001FCD8119|nr:MULTISPECIES: L,D-transpeptidase [Bradyrhizobium]
MTPFRLLFALYALLSCVYADSAMAAVTIRIQLSAQQMDVSVDGDHFATWAVSTARPGYQTPVGTYTPYVLERMHYSRLYNYTPMPYSIFYDTGYAIHGSYETSSLGRPASHGCVRLSPAHAQVLFQLIETQGRANTTIEIIR